MKVPKLFLIWLLTVSGFQPLRAETEPEALQSARSAVESGIPAAAIHPLQTLLAESDPESETARQALPLLVRALNDTGRHEEALQLLQDAGWNEPVLRLARARALAGLGQNEEAGEELAGLLLEETDSEVRQRAVSAKAGLLLQQERWNEAAEALESLEEEYEPDPENRLRLAWAYWHLDNFEGAARAMTGIPAGPDAEAALQLLVVERHQTEANWEEIAETARQVLGDPGQLPDLTVQWFFLLHLARAGLELQEPSEPTNRIIDFIGRSPDFEGLPSLFDLLRILNPKAPPELLTQLQAWSELEIEPVRSEAMASLAAVMAVAGEWEKALEKSQRFFDRYPDHPRTGSLHLIAAESLLALNRPEEAIRLLNLDGETPEPSGAERVLLLGKAAFQLHEYEEAARRFTQAAHADANTRPQALFNLGLATLHAEMPEELAQVRDQLAGEYPETLYGGDLMLEEALWLARQDRSEAGERLEQFLEQFPEHPRAAEAGLILAELAWRNGSPSIALRHLEELQGTELPERLRERHDFLLFLMEDSEDLEAFTNRAEEFLRRYSESPMVDQVRMRVGEAYFDRGIYSHARNHFEILSRRSADPEAAAVAAFLAGRSSMLLMSQEGLDRSIELFEKAARGHSRLRAHARFYQALAKNNLGQAEEAILLLENLLESDPPAQIRYAASIGLATTLLAGEGNANRQDRAIALLAQVARDPDAPPGWKNQAGFKWAKALENAGERDAAASIYYEILMTNGIPGESEETFWYYKAGFDLITLLKRREDWQSAARVYEQLIAAAGPRSGEAREQLDRLRLEHFLWDP